MQRFQDILFLAVFLIISNESAFAYPDFLEAYKADAYHKQRDAGCDLCHANPSGGSERNPFGNAFEAAGMKITPLLRATYPDKFDYTISKLGDTLTIHFSDPDNRTIVIESAEGLSVVDIENKTAHRAEPTPPSGTVSGAAQVPGGDQSVDKPIDSYAREGVFFGQSVVDLPNGKPLKKGGIDFWIAHRFPANAFQASFADLFGFDSVATVAFGIRAGLTDRLSVSLVRVNALRTIELTSAFQILRQNGKTPVTLQLRGSVEGRDNFHLSKDLPWTGYAPSIQVVAVRTFADRLSVLLAPTFAFNTRNELFPPALEFGAESNNTIALGMGAGVRILPATSLVAEWIPRLQGFRGERVDKPEISFGLQKATARHAFALVFSNTRPMTISRYSTNGSNVFGIGFNIDGKLR